MENNEIYQFLKKNNLTTKDESSFLKEYSDPKKAEELHKFFVNNELTTKDSAVFYDTYLKKKGESQPITQEQKVSSAPAESGAKAGESEVPSTEVSAEAAKPIAAAKTAIAPVQKEFKTREVSSWQQPFKQKGIPFANEPVKKQEVVTTQTQPKSAQIKPVELSPKAIDIEEKFNNLSNETAKRLTQMFPGKKINVSYDGDSRSIQEARGYAQRGIGVKNSTHLIGGARDFHITIDGKKVEKQLYKDVLWKVAEEQGLYHLPTKDQGRKGITGTTDVYHIGLVDEAQEGSSFEDLLKKFPALRDTPTTKQAIKDIADYKKKNPNDSTYDKLYLTLQAHQELAKKEVESATTTAYAPGADIPKLPVKLKEKKLGPDWTGDAGAMPKPKEPVEQKPIVKNTQFIKDFNEKYKPEPLDPERRLPTDFNAPLQTDLSRTETAIPTPTDLRRKKPEYTDEQIAEAERIKGTKQQYYDKARELSASGDNAGAMSIYLEGLKTNPNDPDLTYGMGYEFQKQGDNKAAIEEYKKILKSPNEGGHSRPDMVLNAMSNALLQEKDYKAAEEAAKKALSINTKYEIAYLNLANAQLKQGRDKEAEQTIKIGKEIHKINLAEQEPESIKQGVRGDATDMAINNMWQNEAKNILNKVGSNIVQWIDNPIGKLGMVAVEGIGAGVEAIEKGIENIDIGKQLLFEKPGTALGLQVTGALQISAGLAKTAITSVMVATPQGLAFTVGTDVFLPEEMAGPLFAPVSSVINAYVESPGEATKAAGELLDLVAFTLMAGKFHKAFNANNEMLYDIGKRISNKETISSQEAAIVDRFIKTQKISKDAFKFSAELMNTMPKDMTYEQRKAAFPVLLELNRLREADAGLDPAFQKENKKKMAELEKQLQVISKTTYKPVGTSALEERPMIGYKEGDIITIGDGIKRQVTNVGAGILRTIKLDEQGNQTGEVEYIGRKSLKDDKIEELAKRELKGDKNLTDFEKKFYMENQDAILDKIQKLKPEEEIKVEETPISEEAATTMEWEGDQVKPKTTEATVGVGVESPALKDETPILSTPKILSTDGLPDLEIVASKEVSQALESEIGGDKGVIDENTRTIPIQEYDVTSNKRSNQIAEQIEENGWIEPLIVSYDKNGNVYIVEGQHRAAALKELGYDKAPVIVIHEKGFGEQSLKETPIAGSVGVGGDVAAKYPMENKGKWYGEEDYESKGGELVDMTPDEFLSKAKPLEIDEEARDNINDLKEHIKSGKKLDPLTLYSTDNLNVRNSDGRHRAIAAKELGIEKVPVIDYTKEQSLKEAPKAEVVKPQEAKGETIQQEGPVVSVEKIEAKKPIETAFDILQNYEKGTNISPEELNKKEKPSDTIIGKVFDLFKNKFNQIKIAGKRSNEGAAFYDTKNGVIEINKNSNHWKDVQPEQLINAFAHEFTHHLIDESANKTQIEAKLSDIKNDLKDNKPSNMTDAESKAYDFIVSEKNSPQEVLTYAISNPETRGFLSKYAEDINNVSTELIGEKVISNKDINDYKNKIGLEEQNKLNLQNGKESKPAGNRLFNEPITEVEAIANGYYERVFGKKRPEYKGTRKFDREKAKKIADAFDKLKHDPNNPKVKAAYEALVKETAEQYQSMLDAGYEIEVNNNEPYSNSQDMINDLKKNKRIKIFSTESGFGSEAIIDKQRAENPLLRDSGFKDKNGLPLLNNDVFRAVHDFFGHSELGNSFGFKGEENAYQVHARMFSPLARKALATETRGQNSFVNFSGINDKIEALRDEARKLRAEGKEAEAQALVERIYEEGKFADQKIGLLSDEFIDIDETDIGDELKPGELEPVKEKTTETTELKTIKVEPSKGKAKQSKEKVDYSKGKTAAEKMQEDGFVPTSEDEINRYIAENSENPLEIVNAYSLLPKKESKLDYIGQQIEEYGVTLTNAEWDKFLDRNWKNTALAKKFIRKRDRGSFFAKRPAFDTQLQELSEMSGVEITPDDFAAHVQHIMTKKGGTSKEAGIALDFKIAFKELTGKELTPAVARKIISKELKKQSDNYEKFINQESQSIAELEQSFYDAIEKGDIHISDTEGGGYVESNQKIQGEPIEQKGVTKAEAPKVEVKAEAPKTEKIAVEEKYIPKNKDLLTKFEEIDNIAEKAEKELEKKQTPAGKEKVKSRVEKAIEESNLGQKEKVIEQNFDDIVNELKNKGILKSGCK